MVVRADDRPALLAHERGQARRLTPFVTVVVTHARRFAGVAQPALDRPTQAGRPPGLVQHPGAELERRPMTHVLPMAARERGHPVPHLVLVERSDRRAHRHQTARWWTRSPGATSIATSGRPRTGDTRSEATTSTRRRAEGVAGPNRLDELNRGLVRPGLPGIAPV
jgi:hypothetical protein